MRHQIVSERTLLGNLAHEHRNRAAHGLIDINDEDFVVVAEENGTPAACRQNRAHLHFDHRFVHQRTLSAGKRKTSDVHRMGRIRFMRYMGTCESHEIFGPTRLHVRRAESLCVLRHSSPARFGQMNNAAIFRSRSINCAKLSKKLSMPVSSFTSVSKPEASRNSLLRWRCTRTPKVSSFAMATKTRPSSASRCLAASSARRWLSLPRNSKSLSKRSARQRKSAWNRTSAFASAFTAKARANGRRAGARTRSSVSIPQVSLPRAKC